MAYVAGEHLTAALPDVVGSCRRRLTRDNMESCRCSGIQF